MMFCKMVNWAPDEGGAGGGAAAGAGSGDKGGAAGSAGAGGDDGGEKKYSDKDMNALLKGQQEEQVNKLLKDLGLESTGSLKEKIAKLKEYEDKGKTEIEKAQAEAKAAMDKLTAAEQRALTAEMKSEALMAGIPADKIARAVKLIPAYDGETVEAKVKAFLAEMPEFGTTAGGSGESPKPFGGRSKGQGTTSSEQANAALDSVFGTPKK